jgi:hypothetical protein
MDRRRHSSIFSVRSFRAGGCESDHYLVVAKARERLAVSKQKIRRVHMERFYLKTFFKILKEVKDKEQYRVENPNRFTALENLMLGWVLMVLRKLSERLSKFQLKLVQLL